MITQILPPIPESIEKATTLLNAKELVALPTETVYGLAGSAISSEAVEKIFKAKGRPHHDPLIVHVKKEILNQHKSPVQILVQEQILSSDILKWPNIHLLETAMKQFWPGPLTFVLPRGSMIPNEVTGGKDTVGIRCPDHPVFQAVLSALTFPLAAPSANQFGKISPTDASHVLQELSGKIPAIIDGGPCTIGVESTILKVEDMPLRITLLRPGKIGEDALRTHFKVPIQKAPALVHPNQTAEAPGMLDEHYAPQKPLIVVPFPFSNVLAAREFLLTQPTQPKAAFVGMTGVPEEICSLLPSTIRVLSPNHSLAEMAKNLFATLRELDRDLKIETIFIDVPQNASDGLTRAIRDRLYRASRNKPKI